MVFSSISSNIDEVLLIDPCAVFVFGDFKVYHKNWLTCSGGVDRSSELCYNFSFSNNFTQMNNFSTQIPNCDFHSPTLLDLFISFDASICSTDSLHWEILIMLLPQFPLLFHQFHNGMPISW